MHAEFTRLKGEDKVELQERMRRREALRKVQIMLREHGQEEAVRGGREAERRVREVKMEIDRKLTRDKVGYRERLAKIIMRNCLYKGINNAKKVMISPLVPE